MMLEPAQRAGDAPRTAPEQGSPDLPRRLMIRIDGPTGDAGRRAEQAEWLRRRRLERQLHDGAALRISALTLRIGLIRHRAPVAQEDLDSAVDALQDELHAVLQELRDVAGKIYPPLLDQAGLGPALREAAERVSTPVRVHAADERFGPAAEGAAYFAVSGCLDTLDPEAPDVELRLRREPDIHRGALLVVEVAEVDVRHAGSMLEQVSRLGGTIDLTREAGVGTIIVRIPCE
jgi:signal transduction histidine kinase